MKKLTGILLVILGVGSATAFANPSYYEVGTISLCVSAQANSSYDFQFGQASAMQDFTPGTCYPSTYNAFEPQDFNGTIQLKHTQLLGTTDYNCKIEVAPSAYVADPNNPGQGIATIVVGSALNPSAVTLNGQPYSGIVGCVASIHGTHSTQ